MQCLTGCDGCLWFAVADGSGSTSFSGLTIKSVVELVTASCLVNLFDATL